MKKKFKVLILAIILFLICTIFIILSGSTYTIKYDNLNGLNDVENLNVKIEDENVIECIAKKIEDGILKIKVKSKSEGKTFIDVADNSDNFSRMSSIYVHKFGVISFNEYMGDCTGSILIPFSIIILLSYTLFLLITSYRKSVKENMYQYKNIAYLGMIVFIFFTVISQILALFDYKGLINTVNGVLGLFSFATVLFPVTFIISILVIFSNISFNWSCTKFRII